MSVFGYFVPRTLGGPSDNLWNNVLRNTKTERWIDELNHRPFKHLISELHPCKILEIGIAAGVGAKRMINAADAKDGRGIEYYGYDFFDSTPKHNIRNELEKLGVKKICLFEGDSRVTLPCTVPFLPKMDFIYIDGGHSYEVVKSDWKNIQPLIHSDTITVFDDYDSKQGVKQVVDKIEGHQIEFIGLHNGHYKAVVRGSS